MEKLRGYHCNICGAWLLIGEHHVCEKERLEVIDRIVNFFSQPHDNSESVDELKGLLEESSTTKKNKKTH